MIGGRAGEEGVKGVRGLRGGGGYQLFHLPAAPILRGVSQSGSEMPFFIPLILVSLLWFLFLSFFHFSFLSNFKSHFLLA